MKYGQRDAANEILRTEVLAQIAARQQHTTHEKPLFVVTYPEAMAELVVSQKHIDDHRLSLSVGQRIDIVEVEHRLRDLGFTEQDYVYEPGQFAVRGSILDVYSYSSELPFRIDFFGDEIDTIRSFSVEDQLSKERRTEVEVVPELAKETTEKVPFLRFVPDDAVLVCRDLSFICDTVERVYNEGFSSQALTERLEDATEMEQAEIQRDMNRESVLCSPLQFKEDILELDVSSMATLPMKRIPYFPSMSRHSRFSIKISICSVSRSRTISCAAIISIFLLTVANSNSV